MTEKFVPFGGDKHVVKTDCKLCGPASGVFGSVVFRSRDELDSVIAGLVKLRDGWDDPAAHFHLQDYGVGKSGGSTSLEVTFTTPAWADTELEKEFHEKSIVDAQKSLATCDVTDDRIGVVLKQLARGPTLVQ